MPESKQNRRCVAVLAIGPNGLGAVRSLGEEGVAPYVIAYNESDLALYSRFADKKKRSFLSAEGLEDKVSELAGLLSELPVGTILIPTSDWFVSVSISIVEEFHLELTVAGPGKEISSMLIDKSLETTEVAKYCRVPKTINSLPESQEQLLNAVSLPIIVKPRSFEYSINAKTIQVRNQIELESLFDKFEALRESLIVQEIIEGDDENLWVCNCVFSKDNNLVSANVFRRLGLSPSHFGVTSLAVSEQNEELIEIVRRLGRGLGYVGPAMVEFKYCHDSQDYFYIELNPRLGLCNYFDTRCGSNTAYVTFQVFSGDNDIVQPNRRKTKSGVYFVSLFEDVYSRRKDGEKFSQILFRILKLTLKPKVFIYSSIRDPIPGFVAFLRLLRAMLRTNK